MAFGVTDLFGLSAPSVGYVSNSTQKKTLGYVTLRDQLGVTKCVALKSNIEVEATIKGKGDTDIGSMAASRMTGVGSITLISKQRTETLEEYPDFEDMGRGYETAVSTAATVAGTPPTLGVGCPLIGIVSTSIAQVTSFEITEKLEEADVVLYTDGEFVHQDFFDPRFEFSVKGKGDLPAVLVLGSDGGLPDTVGAFATGVCIITDTTEDQTNEGEPTWDISGVAFPAAA